VPADGLRHQEQDENGVGFVTITCGSGQLTFTAEQGGQSATATITVLSDTQIQVSSQGAGSEGTNGIFTKEEDGTATPNAPTPSPNTPAPAASGCPVFNGRYTRNVEGQTIGFTVNTKNENGAFSYQFSDNEAFIPADGQRHRVEEADGSGYITASCGNQSLKVVAEQDGRGAINLVYTPVGDTQLQVQASGEGAEVLNGVYTRQ
jgi:hypothetical protein